MIVEEKQQLEGNVLKVGVLHAVDDFTYHPHVQGDDCTVRCSFSCRFKSEPVIFLNKAILVCEEKGNVMSTHPGDYSVVKNSTDMERALCC